MRQGMFRTIGYIDKGRVAIKATVCDWRGPIKGPMAIGGASFVIDALR